MSDDRAGAAASNINGNGGLFRSEICNMLGITYPVFQGGMAWVADAQLAAAVSNAGGLGIIAAGNAPADVVRAEIKKAKQLTDKPFAVNIMLMSPNVDEIANVIVEENVKIVLTGAGSPERFMNKWRDNGVIIIPVVPSSAIARRMERCGASAIVAEGGEAGGHVGDLTTMALVPQVCDAVSVPVVAAGGIGDGRGVAAAFMLGASGVQIGTRFLVAKECNIHQNYKKKILGARDIDTIVTGRRLGHPVRSLKTPFSRDFLAKEYDGSVSNEELEAYGAGSLRLATECGDLEHGSFMAGQSAGLVKREQTVAEIIEEMCAEAAALLKGAIEWVN